MADRPLRLVTATSLFDGHDASINIFRRILQRQGAEVIHLGHDRSAADIAVTAIEEDAQGIAVTSYQGGHMEFFTYLRRLLDEHGGEDVAVFGGGGGTILPDEGEELARMGVAKIYSPDDGRAMGLDGMVADMLARADRPVGEIDDRELELALRGDHRAIGRLISAAENHADKYTDVFEEVRARGGAVPVVGVTGTGGSGKSSLVDELVRRILADPADLKVAVISIDPTRRRSGGALLGDRIRMNSIPHPRAYMRSMATREANRAVSASALPAIEVVKAAGFDLVIVETSGIGQSDSEITDLADVSLYVMTPEYGAASQLEKIDMLDLADLIVINKADRQGAADAIRDVRKQYRRNRGITDGADDELPIHLTIASEFNDQGTTGLYRALMSRVFPDHRSEPVLPAGAHVAGVIPGNRQRYLAEIVETIARYNRETERVAGWAEEYQQAQAVAARLKGRSAEVAALAEEARAKIPDEVLTALEGWDETMAGYRGDEFGYRVRDRNISVPLRTTSLSGTPIPKVAVPGYRGWGDRARWLRQENLPGSFPYTAGIYPFKRGEEDPTRMFAGEGTPEQTNRRFHLISRGMSAKRLSTAFDSVTLYGQDPDPRPDIFGKVGNSGVSVSTLDDAKKLYSGFDLCDPSTSVSMTINGPAPMMLAFFMNAAIDQQCELHIRAQGMEESVEAVIAAKYPHGNRPGYEGDLPAGHNGLGLMLLGVGGDEVLDPELYRRIAADTMTRVRGTVQADILKEDQAQNTCIFSTDFALRMMGDIQQAFVDREVRNFYSVSISGYHMAEAGANPITQLAFTLANGFTYVEYYLARGMHIDDFAPNLSFFFSNGIDPEYAVIGRVARRIWSKALRQRYGANDRSQKLKYHIQTSGRSLHAQEISFNDIRTTLQALYAIYDNCNSLHTNAYDEAITTPTEESVRRALAIQLIINQELGLAKTENPLQGSFIIEELTDLVEEAVLAEFDRLDSRGGVLGAMERQYQRTKIQEESMHYERFKETGQLPIVGVNTFLSATGSPFELPATVVRSTDDAKRRQIENLNSFKTANGSVVGGRLTDLQRAAVDGENVFDALMETAKVASLGQMAEALFAVGGRYRRNM